MSAERDPLALAPVSRRFGFDRGRPICRYYIENFLAERSACIRGRVLEVADNAYTRAFGSGVERSEVLHVQAHPNATIVGNLETGENIPRAAFDCIILTQTLHVIYGFRQALGTAIAALRPGGTLLLTAPGISQISRFDMDRWGDFWRFTDRSLGLLLREFLPAEAIDLRIHGNVAVAKAYLDGLAAEELPREVLDHVDQDYQVLLCVAATRPREERP